MATLVAIGVMWGGCDSSSDDPAQDPGRSETGGTDVPASPDGAADEAPEVYVVPNPSGKGHGQPCQQDSECQFLRCIEAPTVTGGQFRICTKDCASGAFASCSLEGSSFLCLRTTPGAGNEIVSFCGLLCDDAGQCPSEYGDCRIVVGAQKTCAVPGL